MKIRNSIAFVALILIFPAASAFSQQPLSTDEPSTRHFEFIYSGTVKAVPENSKIRIWIPLAYTTADQSIVQMTSQLPGDARETKESVYGNRMLYFEYNTDQVTDLPFLITYEVRRNEVNALRSRNAEILSDEDRWKYTRANRLVPIDGKPIFLLDGIKFPEDQMDVARQLYERVDAYMTYDKSNPGFGNGDVSWACDSKTGNCTDFHSLFISWARSRKIPARFEIGFPLPRERGAGKVGGYHCWGKFFIEGKGWVPVDISEADKYPEMKDYYFGNLTEDRIAFTRGRDVDLQPKQDGPPLNYFIYPHVEVDGNVWPIDKIDLDFRYHDLEADQVQLKN